jgi:hypothetical protein
MILDARIQPETPKQRKGIMHALDVRGDWRRGSRIAAGSVVREQRELFAVGVPEVRILAMKTFGTVCWSKDGTNLVVAPPRGCAVLSARKTRGMSTMGKYDQTL